MEKTRSFEELLVRQKAHEFVLLVCKLTEDSSKSEMYGLTSKFRRAAVSVAANIAHSSSEEYRYYIILSRDLNYRNTPSFFDVINEIAKLLNAYSKQSIKIILTQIFYLLSPKF